MGCYDRAELCETFGCYILNELNGAIRKESTGLDRDDCLDILENIEAPEIERKHKNLVNAFKKSRLKITLKTNVTFADSVDVRLNLKEKIYYKPYRKQNSNPTCFKKYSNNPPNIIRDFKTYHLTKMYMKKLCL